MSRGTASRAYASPLRQDQVEHTRERILDGLLLAMRDGLADLSIPAVARAAKVSVPTVYRHFSSKKQLFEAVAEHITRRTPFQGMLPPSDPESLFLWVHEVFARHEAMDPVIAAAMSGALGGEVRRRKLIPDRLAMFEKALAPALQALPPDERAHLRHAVVALTASATLRTFKTYLGLSSEAAAQTVVWTLRTLIEAAGQRSGAKKPRRLARNGQSR